MENAQQHPNAKQTHRGEKTNGHTLPVNLPQGAANQQQNKRANCALSKDGKKDQR